MNASRPVGTLTALFGVLFLSACGGGGGVDEFARLRSDPNIVRLGGILQSSDTLLMPSVHVDYSLTMQGQTRSERLTESFTCAGPRCVGNGGTVFTVMDLIDPSTDIGVTIKEVTLGSAGGFDTFAASVDINLADIDLSDTVPGVSTITDGPSAYNYGLWGQYGAVLLQILDGPWSGQTIQGASFTGDISTAAVYALGNATGTNPAGMGSATWSGIAEAASTSTFQRREGTATLTIADLSQPRVGVDIDITGFAINSPGWADMPLTNGRFATGDVGSDRMEGQFYGPSHDEAYGVFDTGVYVGGFGAKRTQ